jgi:hypothetical protein
MLEAIDERATWLAWHDLPHGAVLRPCTRTDLIKEVLARDLVEHMSGDIAQSQLDFCKDPEDIFRLWVMYARAKQGIKGYGFTTEMPQIRYVYSPETGTLPYKLGDKLHGVMTVKLSREEGLLTLARLFHIKGLNVEQIAKKLQCSTAEVKGALAKLSAYKMLDKSNNNKQDVKK